MQLNLKKNLAFIDLETTGINISTDRIVEIAVLKVMPDGSSTNKTKRINPTIPIPEEVSMIHGIYEKDIESCPTFKETAHELEQFLANCDLAGFNAFRFDIPLLIEEFHRAGITFKTDGRKFVDVQNIFHKMEPRNLSAAYQFYCNKELNNAHSAEADINATYEILLAQLDKYKDKLDNDIDSLHDSSIGKDNVDFARRMIFNDKRKEIFNFGKYKGKIVEEILKREPQYYDWIMKNDFSIDTKQKLTAIYLRNFNK